MFYVQYRARAYQMLCRWYFAVDVDVDVGGSSSWCSGDVDDGCVAYTHFPL